MDDNSDRREMEEKVEAADTFAVNSSETYPLESVGSESELSGQDEKDFEKDVRPTPHRTITTTSTAMSVSTTTTRTTVQPKAKKVWYKRLNPLKWGEKPPVPKERIVSREYGASFFSMLTFQWMAPLMTVSKISRFQQACHLC